jgi:hypothetical protein
VGDGVTAADQSRRQKREYAHCAAARRQGARVERFARSEIYARDGGVCGICGRHVPAPDSSLDHVVPISRGGIHTPANVRLAHFDCNAQRGNWNFCDTRMTRYRTDIPCAREGWSFREREFRRQVAEDLEALRARCGYEEWADVRRWLGPDREWLSAPVALV